MLTVKNPEREHVNYAYRSKDKSNLTFCFAVMICLCTLLFFEFAARFLVYVAPPPQTENEQIECKYNVIRSLVDHHKPFVFCMGDSMMNRAIYPDLLEAFLAEHGMQVDVVNLAVDGSPPDLAVKLLDFAASRNIVPSLVLYDLPVDCLTSLSYTKSSGRKDKLSMLTRRDNYDVKAVDGTQIGKDLSTDSSGKDINHYLWTFARQKSILLRYQAYFKSKIRKFFHDAFDFRRYEELISKHGLDYSSASTSHLGWSPNHEVIDHDKLLELEPKFDKVLLETNKLRFGNKNKDVNISAFEMLRDFCIRHHARFSLVWLPHYVPFFEKRGFYAPESYQSLSKKIESLESPNTNLYTIVLSEGNGTLHNYTDPWHLNTYGAVVATKALAEAICRKSVPLLGK